MFSLLIIKFIDLLYPNLIVESLLGIFIIILLYKMCELMIAIVIIRIKHKIARIPDLILDYLF